MSIKQAIEALESCTPGDYSTGHVIHPSYDEDKVNAAIAALRSMPAEPVEAATTEAADFAGALAYQLTKRLVIDMPTARSIIDDAIRATKGDKL